MRYIKKYNEGIDFSSKEYKVIMVGMPSGEVLEATYTELGDLFAVGLVKYVSYKNTTGFYSFKDENIEQILDVIKPNRQKFEKDILIKDNKFPTSMLDKLMYMLNDFNDIEITIEDYSLMISYGNILLDILYDDESSPKYLLIKRIKGDVNNKYSIPSDDLLIRCIIRELS